MKSARGVFLLGVVVAVCAGIYQGTGTHAAAVFDPVNLHPLPGFADLNDIELRIVRTESDTRSVDTSELSGKISETLDEAGFHVHRLGVVTALPQILVQIRTMNIADSNQCVYHIQTDLVRLVVTPQRPADRFMASVAIDSVTRPMAMGALNDRIDEEVASQVQKLINITKVAERISGAKPMSPAIQAVSGNSTGAFVASRNSAVFHRSDCRSAERISAENRVYYASRDEAIADGKRPCGICKP